MRCKLADVQFNADHIRPAGFCSIARHPLKGPVSGVCDMWIDIRRVVLSGFATIDVLPDSIDEETFLALVKVELKPGVMIETDEILSVYITTNRINLRGGRFFDVIPREKRDAVYPIVNNWLKSLDELLTPKEEVEP